MTLRAPRSPRAPALFHFSARHFHSAIRNLAFFFLLSAHALQFPDTADLEKDYRVAARKDGRPVELFRKAEGDSVSLHLDWTGGAITGVRMEQEEGWEPDSFSALTNAYGNGAAWHESQADERSRMLYAGLQQTWILKGYGGEKGWLGSGLDRGRFFLVFRETPPTAMVPVAGPLRLNRGLFAFLDTSSQWMHLTCRDEGDGSDPGGPSKAQGKGKAKAESKANAAVCFTPTDDSRFRVRIDRKKPLSLQVWMEEGKSSALEGIKNALQSVPDAGQAEYAQDLSQMLLGEAQTFLVKLSQRLPAAFNWPSWQIQDFKEGRIPPAAYLPLVRRQVNPGDSLPAFRFQDSGLRLSVNLYYGGRFHLAAEENGTASQAH